MLEARFLNAMAAVAVGLFIGQWVLGPAISHDTTRHEALRSAADERAMINAGTARPDPSPYRTPTPDFGAPFESHYAKRAKEKALASLGRWSGPRDVVADSGSVAEVPWPDRALEPAPRAYRALPFDRHTGIHY